MSATDDFITAAAAKASSWKFACDLCEASSNLVLAGEQTIDDEDAEVDMRVLATAQDEAAENGPWIVQNGAWVRPPDYADGQPIIVTIPVARGTDNSGIWRLTSPAFGTITVNQTETTWIKVGDLATSPGTPDDGSVTAPKIAANAVTTTKINDAAVTTAKIADGNVTFAKLEALVKSGLLRFVRIATTANDSLSGLSARDGVTPTAGDRVLVKDHATGASKGIYVAAAGAWARAADFDATGEVVPGMLIVVEAGTSNGGKCFRVSNTGSITVGSTALTFAEFGAGGGSSASISASGASVDTTGGDLVMVTPAGGDVTLTTDGDLNFAVVSGVTTVDAVSNTLNLGPNASDIAVGQSGAATVVVEAGSINHRVGSSDQTHTISGANRSVVTEDAAGSTACTDLYDNAACSRTVVGDYTQAAANTTITSTTTTTLNCTYFSMTASGGSASLTCSLVGRFNGYGGLELNSNTGQVGMGHPAKEDELLFVMPTSVTPGSSAATAIGTITVPASSSGDFTGTVSVRNGSGNSKVFTLTFSWNADGTTVTVRDLAAADLGTTQGTIGTVFGDIDNTASGLVVTIRAANASGFRCAVRGLARVNL